MKILYFIPSDGSFMGRWQFTQIFDELSHYDVSFDLFNPLEYNSYEEANELLIKRVREDQSIDLFMNCASSEMLFEETMKELSVVSIPKLLICFDNLHAPYMHKSIAKYFDLIWLTSKETEHMFKRWGGNTVFLPYASNPFAFKDLYSATVDKVCFVGTPYGTRTMLFNNLAQGGVDVDVFCKSGDFYESNSSNQIKTQRRFRSKIKIITNFMSFQIGRKILYSKIKKELIGNPNLAESEHIVLKDKLSNEDMNRTYSNYALSLNIIALRNTAILKNPIPKLHLRTFEIPMCGGLELVEYNDELSGYFSENEMVYYKDKEEMIDKAMFYTNAKNESIILSMKHRARERAVKEHCWMNRFSVVFDMLRLKYNKTTVIGINN